MKRLLILGGTLLCQILTGPGVAAETASIQKTCFLIGNKLTSVSTFECLQRRLRESGHHTARGIPILYKEYPPLPSRKPLARVLLIGGIHGDEYSSFSVVFKWMAILDKYHSGLFHWHIAPALNTDGLLNNPATRTNANGVDINRNFDIVDSAPDAMSALEYWEKFAYKNPRRYPGAEPFSESETRWLAHEIATFNPDVIIAVHAPYNMLDYDGPSHITPPDRLGSLKLGHLEAYPISLGRYASRKFNLPVLTIELASANRMLKDDELRAIWVDLVRWLRHNIRSP